MRRLLLISLVTIPLTGCQFFNRDGNTVVDIVESVESGEALDGISVPQLGGDDPADPEKAAFEAPTVEKKPGVTVSADLINSTDPDARAKAVARNRTDPFATLPILPDPVVIVPEVNNQTANASARAAGNNTASSGNAAANARPAPTPPPVRVQAPNAPLVVPSPIARLPTIPQPVIAPTISVSGVIQLGNEPYAIVRSGNEPERYVRVGDRLAGGSVRVKRIETLAFEPRVILEENGIEVVRPITNGETAAEETGPVAFVPNALAVPAAAVPSSGRLPVMPTSAVLSAPGSTQNRSAPGASQPASSLQPAPGFVPGSLLLQPAELTSKAVLPNFRLSVPASV